MHKRTIKFEDLDGNEVEQTFYFHLNKAEVLEILARYNTGRTAEQLESAIETEDLVTIFAEMSELVLTAFGEKSPDGLSFDKSRRDWFKGTNAYGELVSELGSDDKKALEFMEATFPKGMVAFEVEDQDKPKGPPPVPSTNQGE